MRRRPRPVMMRRGHRFTGGRVPPPDEVPFEPRSADDVERPLLPDEVDERIDVALPAAREVRSVARPEVLPDGVRREEERLGEFLRWSATPPRYRANHCRHA